MSTAQGDEEDKLFFTRSDLLKRLNASLDSYDASTNGGFHDATTIEKPKFELQKRLPDGSAISADSDDIAAADFQDKVKQAAAAISLLSADEKLDWAKKQRQHGNQFFQKGDYKNAMDVYMTCFVAMDPACFQKSDKQQQPDESVVPTNDTNNRIPSSSLHPTENQTSDDVVNKTQRELLLPVLLNLSLCTLKLGMFKKTERFCNFALEAPCGKENAKVYFRRGKARMLMGSYKGAKEDLENSLRLLCEQEQQQSSSSTITMDIPTLTNEKESILKEINKLKKLTKQAEVNSNRQKHAMRRMLGGERKPIPSEETKMTKLDDSNAEVDYTNSSNASKVKSQEDEYLSSLYNTTRTQRPYSTLTAPEPHEQIHFDTWKTNETNVVENNSFAIFLIRTCLSVFEKCLRRTLYILGDKDAMIRSYDDDEFEERLELVKSKIH